MGIIEDINNEFALRDIAIDKAHKWYMENKEIITCSYEEAIMGHVAGLDVLVICHDRNIKKNK